MSENEDYYAGFSLGRIVERERIIGVIQSLEDHIDNWGGSDWIEMPTNKLLAHIRGEVEEQPVTNNLIPPGMKAVLKDNVWKFIPVEGEE